MEENSTLNSVRRQNNIKDTFNEQKKKIIIWFEKISSLNTDKDTNKLLQLVRSLNDETATKYSTAVFEENNTYYTGKKVANILAEFYKKESSCNTPLTKLNNKSVKA